MTKRTIFSAIVVAWLVPAAALAQDAPAEAEQHAATVGEQGEDDITLTLNAGAALNYGNARNFAVNLGGNFTLRRGQHAFLAEVGWIYGLQSVRDADDVDMDMDTNEFLDWVDSSNNFTGRLRYDFFADPDNSFFVVGRVRADPFALLQPRIQGQAGWMHNLMREESHRFWFELGVDVTYDNFGEAIALSPTVTSNDRSLFAARGFLGYSNEINDFLKWNSGLEVLWVFARTPQEIDPGHFRFEWINQFRSTIEDWFQLSLDITARLDSQPPGQASPWDEQSGQPTQMFDLIATLNLVGNFDLDGDPAAEEEAEPEPEPAAECPVCPEPEPCPECEPCEECEQAPAEEVEEPEAESPEAESPEAEPTDDAEAPAPTE